MTFKDNTNKEFNHLANEAINMMQGESSNSVLNATKKKVNKLNMDIAESIGKDVDGPDQLAANVIIPT